MEYVYRCEINKDITLRGDSIYTSGSKVERDRELSCRLMFAVITCHLEPELDDGNEVWHNDIVVIHNRTWDFVYTDSGFLAEVNNIIRSLVMDPEQLFQLTIRDELRDYCLNYTTQGDQHNSVATLETGDWIVDWVKENGR